MSSYIRPRIGGASIFFTVALAHRGSDLLVREIGTLRRAVADTRRERPFEIEAWVVMPDHLHAVWRMPEDDSDYSVRWGAIKARFTRDVCRAGFTPPSRLPRVETGRFAGVNPGLRPHKGERGIWQRRFWEHHIRDDADWRAHVEYCWFNPVKHGFVTDHRDWPHSSYDHRRLADNEQKRFQRRN